MLLILDKDGTLVTPKSGKKFVQYPQDQMLLPGVEEGLLKTLDFGIEMVIASNQGGIAMGYKTEAQAIEEMIFCMNLCPSTFRFALFCPDMDGDQCILVTPTGSFEPIGKGTKDASLMLDELGVNPDDVPSFYRKPEPGMLYAAMLKIGATPEECLFVGDREEDEQAAEAAGIEFQAASYWREHAAHTCL